jgi:hypothetical protein
MADERDLLDPQRVEQRRDVTRHSTLVIARGRLFGLPIPAQIGNDQAVELAQHRDLVSPGIIGLGEAVQQHDRRPLARIDEVLANAVGAERMVLQTDHGCILLRL